MATTPYGLKNDAVRCQKIPSVGWNLIANTTNLIGVEIAEYAGAGFLLATDFNFTPTGGAAKTGSVSTGRVIVGATGEKKLVYSDDVQAVTFVGTNASPQTNYGYVTQNDGAVTIVQNPMDAPPNSHLAFTGYCDDTGISAVNQFPAGRTNLLSFLAAKVSANDRQGGYLNGKLTAGSGITLTEGSDGGNETLQIASSAGPFTSIDLPEFEVTLADRDEIILKLDFSDIGQFEDGAYHVFLTLTDQGDAPVDPGIIQVVDVIGNKTGDTLWLGVRVACDAGLLTGTLLTEDIKFNVSVGGHEYTSNAGASLVVTPYEWTNCDEGRWVEVTGDTMTGPLIIAPTAGVPIKLWMPTGYASADLAWGVYNPTGATLLHSLTGGGLMTARPESAGNGVYECYAYGTGLNPGVRSRSARGTRGSEANLSPGDIFRRDDLYGWGGGDWRVAARLTWTAQETFSATAAGARLGIFLSPIGSITPAEAMRLTALGVNIGAANPRAAAKLQVDSTTQGFLPPRVTTTERDAISVSAADAGLTVYNTTTNKLNFYNGTSWEAVTSA